MPLRWMRSRQSKRGRIDHGDVLSAVRESLHDACNEGTCMKVSPLELTRRRVRLADLFELTKPRITLMVLITTLVGFYMGSRDKFNFVLLLNTILGTAFVASGASALNEY